MAYRKRVEPKVRVPLTASCFVAFFLGCESLPEIEPCGPCESECPNDMKCVENICVPPEDEGLCTEDVPGTSGTGGAGGMTVTTSAGGSMGGDAASGGSGGNPTVETTLGAAGMGEAGDGGTAGTAGGCEPPRTQCVPDNAQLTHEHEACGNRAFSIQLKAQCECDPPEQERNMVWFDTALPEGLALTESGELSGTLPPGTYTIVTPAHLAGDSNAVGHLEQTLHVLDRCLVTFLSEDESPGVPRVQAVRLDTLDVDGWMPEDDDVAVESYDISSDGSYLAAVVDGGDSLELFSLADEGVSALEFEHDGTLLAHAFSPDASWLAVITTDPDTSDGQLLHLVKFEGETWRLVEVASSSYSAGLAWFGDNRIVYMGTSGAAPPSLAPLVRNVTEAGLSSVTEISDALIDPSDRFDGFLTNDAGFVSSTQYIPGFVDLAGEFYVFADGFNAVSPGVRYRALVQPDVLIVNPMTWLDNRPPYATGEGCGELRAWSADDSTFVCSTADTSSVFEVEGNGDLHEIELDVDIAWSHPRAALSTSGDWLAFVPTAAGLQVLPKHSFAEPLGEPLLEPLIGGWDFFFTPSERKIVVQQGDRLWVAELNEQGPGEPQDVDVKMNPVVCEGVWPASNPSAWCGAPAFAGNMLLSANERYLAVRDDERSVVVIPLDTLEPETIGSLSESCSEGCIQFQ